MPNTLHLNSDKSFSNVTLEDLQFAKSAMSKYAVPPVKTAVESVSKIEIPQPRFMRSVLPNSVDGFYEYSRGKDWVRD